MAKTPPHSGKAWTPQQEARWRREAAGNTPTRVIALHMGRSEDAARSIGWPMHMHWLPFTTLGYMVGDYV